MKIIKSLTLILALMPTLVTGQTREQFLEKSYSQKLSGFKGIVFICSYDANDKTLERICQRAVTDIMLHGASNKVNIKLAEANNFVESMSIANDDDFVTLEYEITATQNNEQFDTIAVHAHLSLEIYYSQAIEKGASNKSINGIPRSGDLELWSRSVIGSGNPSDIVEPFSDNTEMLLKQALTLFIKYAK